MFHKRNGRHSGIDEMIYLDPDLLSDNEEDDCRMSQNQQTGWNEDLEFYWKRIKLTARRNRKGSILLLATLALLVILKSTLISTSKNENTLLLLEPFTMESQLKSPLHQVILPPFNQLYPNKNPINEKLDVEMFDFRFGSSLILLYLQNLLKVNEGSLPMDLKIPFSWRDWINFPDRLKFDDDFLLDWLQYHSPLFLDSIDDLKSLNCTTFCLLYGCEASTNFERACKVFTPTKGYPYKFRIDQHTDTKIKEPGRALISTSYLYHHMPNPKRLYLLGINDENVVLQVDQDYQKREKFLRSNKMIKSLMEWNSEVSKFKIEDNWKMGWDISHFRDQTAEILQNRKAELIIQSSSNDKLRKDRSRIVKLKSVKEGMKMEHWTFEHFVWNEFQFLDEQMHKSLEPNNALDNELFQNVINIEKHRLESGNHPKYFHEANLYDTGLGSHYDWRFFSTSLMLNDFKKSIIHRLARTWLRFCFQNELKTFIAYGSMLGWSDNGLTLPWDTDIDVLVTMESLNRLARDFNQTLIIDYTAKDGVQSAMTGYFIDINPTYYSRVKGDGGNAIDGRLIDISTGMYIDITALAWTEDYLKEIELTDKIKNLIDKDYKTNHIFALEGSGIYEDTLLSQLKDLQNDHQLVHCKNNMVYKIDELRDMLPSYFEGARAHFPSKFQDILLRFYPKSYKRVFFEHNFKKYLRLWASWVECPYSDEDDEEGKLCESLEIQQEYRLTKNYTQRHFSISESTQWDQLVLTADSESKPMRIDEFFIEYGNWLGLSNEEIEEIYLS